MILNDYLCLQFMAAVFRMVEKIFFFSKFYHEKKAKGWHIFIDYSTFIIPIKLSCMYATINIKGLMTYLLT